MAPISNNITDTITTAITNAIEGLPNSPPKVPITFNFYLSPGPEPEQFTTAPIDPDLMAVSTIYASFANSWMGTVAFASFIIGLASWICWFLWHQDMSEMTWTWRFWDNFRWPMTEKRQFRADLKGGVTDLLNVTGDTYRLMKEGFGVLAHQNDLLLEQKGVKIRPCIHLRGEGCDCGPDRVKLWVSSVWDVGPGRGWRTDEGSEGEGSQETLLSQTWADLEQGLGADGRSDETLVDDEQEASCLPLGLITKIRKRD
ncbi:hypothetical protein B0T20DRAFT_468016 [Sordaria brevicollis]|uniref:Uncharacterized protein n=1 Tax=Sordaria brevicollis TaxID=83679 RepID=A0AAE0UD11_SORBR|nr:hypothetical protein B0T20DRAFT_468016 [Sordaria brevicollis]